MSKSRGNFLDPHAVVAAFGADGARYVTLREVAFDKDTEVSWDSFVRRYNADLANDFGNLVNRTMSMVNRYMGGERPAPRAAGDSPLAEGWLDTLRLYREKLDGYLLHDALAELWEFVGGANKTRRRGAAVDAGEAAKAGDEEAGTRLRARPRRSRRGVPARRDGASRRSCRRRHPDPGAAGLRLGVRAGRQRRARRAASCSSGVARPRPAA